MVEDSSNDFDIGLVSTILGQHRVAPRGIVVYERKCLVPIDWTKAARLVAEGAKPAAIVKAVGCSRSQLSRRQRHCGLFRALIEQYAAALRGDPPSLTSSPQLKGPIAERVREKLEHEILDGNTRVAIWVAEQLRLFTPEAGQDAEQKLESLLKVMSDAEREAFTRPD